MEADDRMLIPALECSACGPTTLGMLAKYWQPGEVKTRLASAIGAEHAGQVYRAFVELMLARFQQVADCRVLAVTPVERVREFQQLAGQAWRVVPQSSGDFGQRMEAFFEDRFRQGAQRVVLIGSDTPTLPSSYVAEAFVRLRTAPVVLGPADDGGYYLVGATNRVPPIFTEITWSTSLVWEQTVECLRAADCPFATLPPWYDIDDAESLERLRLELLRDAAHQPGWGQLLEVLQRVAPAWEPPADPSPADPHALSSEPAERPLAP